ncbi:MAG: divergent polysaccharide deacetylase family protein [bacterium]|nr:divergent polysaccharide deacetylase family protein [bacterium]
MAKKKEQKTPKSKKESSLQIINSIFFLLVLLILAILGLDYLQKKAGLPGLFDSFRQIVFPDQVKDPGKVSREITLTLDETLERLGLKEFKSGAEVKEAPHSTSWIHSKREVKAASRNRDLKEYEAALTEAATHAGGLLLSRTETHKPEYEAVSLTFGLPSRPLHSITIRRPSKPEVAIIIDDAGYAPKIDEFLSLDCPLAIAVLPHLAYSRQTAQQARQANKEVMLHMPMEPNEYPERNPGKGAVLSEMSKTEIRETLQAALRGIPFVVGVNNHMGSRATEDERIMSVIIDELKRKNLYFVDSMTSSESVGYTLARQNKVRTEKRQVFLDNLEDEAAIKAQLKLLVETAKSRGSAIGIGHVQRTNTARVLRDMLPQLKEEVEIVPVSMLVN